MFEANALSALALALAAGALGTLAVVDLLRPAAEDGSSDSRDKAPLLFRVVLPIARRYAGDIHLESRKREALEERLASAGMTYAIFPKEFVALRWLFAAFAAVGGVYSAAVMGSPWLQFSGIGLAAAVLGFFYPQIWLRDAIKRRQREFEKYFPFLLELLSLSMRAGLTFSAALQQAAVQLPDGAVQQELARARRDIRTGRPRAEALRRFADRVRLPAVTNFVAAVLQAEQSGGSLGEVLADQARQRRQERFARAEKLANEAPVKMLLPLVALLFPVTFIIIGFPIALQFFETGAVGFLN